MAWDWSKGEMSNSTPEKPEPVDIRIAEFSVWIQNIENFNKVLKDFGKEEKDVDTGTA